MTGTKIAVAALMLGGGLLLGCSAHRQAPSEPVGRRPLEGAAIWNAAAAWDHDEEHLIVLDPIEHCLTRYTAQGRIVERVPLDAIVELDYSTPIRLLTTDSGFVLGDRRHLVELDRELAERRVIDVFERLRGAGIEEGMLNDFVLARGGVVAFLDFRRSGRPEQEWYRGFARLDLDRGRFVPLLEMPLEDGEYARYYLYDRRPYLAAEGRRVHVLRFSRPPALFRAGRSRLEAELPLELGELRAVAVYAWSGRLWVLVSGRDLRMEVAESIEAGLSREQVRAQAMREDRSPRQQLWRLLELDADDGRVLSDRLLPTEAERVHLVPGRRNWALVEEAHSLDGGEPQAVVSLLLVPSPWFEGATSLALE